MDKQLEFITKELIEEAANNIDINNIPKNHEGKSYAVDINGDLYPFKLLIMEAAKIEGFELNSADFGSNEANRKGFEEITGYVCVKKEHTFHELMNELRPLLKKDNSVLKDFEIYETKEDSRWAWVVDHKKIISIENCHYEIIKRRKKVYVEIHFEGKQKDVAKFINNIKVLPDNLEWFKWLNHKSIRYKDYVLIDNKNAAESLKDKLLYLEDNIGNVVRNIIINKEMVKNEEYLNKPNMKTFPLNQILYGPPGTGKTYNSIKEAVRIANPEFDIHQDWETIKKEYDLLVEAKQIVFTTFHQSMNYEDFVEGIKPQEPKEEGQNITYKVEDGVFKLICKRANPVHGNFEEVIEAFKKDISEVDGKDPITIKGKGTTFDVKYTGTLVFYVQPHASAKEKPWYPVNIANIEKAFTTDNYDGVYNQTYVREIINYLTSNKKLRKGDKKEKSKNNYVLIIDEINRGNVSSIFGELITLIEENKRIDNKEAITVTLPYSKKEFGVPKNLHIIGTMNTADRSVEALDTALRRRFTFTEMPPESGLIKEIGEIDAKLEIDGKEFNLEVILETINKRIEILLDRDHLIGHSFFIKVKNEAGLRTAIGKEIMPLMQEYFYGDYGKISLVLGEGFCKGEKKNENNGVFAKAKDYDADGYLEKMIYQLHDPAAKALGNDHYQMDATTFKNALLLLLNQNTDKNEQEE